MYRDNERIVKDCLKHRQRLYIEVSKYKSRIEQLEFVLNNLTNKG